LPPFRAQEGLIKVVWPSRPAAGHESSQFYQWWYFLAFIYLIDGAALLGRRKGVLMTFATTNQKSVEETAETAVNSVRQPVGMLCRSPLAVKSA